MYLLSKNWPTGINMIKSQHHRSRHPRGMLILTCFMPCNYRAVPVYTPTHRCVCSQGTIYFIKFCTEKNSSFEEIGTKSTT